MCTVTLPRFPAKAALDNHTVAVPAKESTNRAAFLGKCRGINVSVLHIPIFRQRKCGKDYHTLTALSAELYTIVI